MSPTAPDQDQGQGSAEHTARAVEELLQHLIVPQFVSTSSPSLPEPPPIPRSDSLGSRSSCHQRPLIRTSSTSSNCPAQAPMAAPAPMQTENMPPLQENMIPSAASLMPNVIGIEEFEAEHLAAIEARVQARLKSKGVNTPSLGKTQLAQPGPIPLGTPRKAEFVAKFNNLCQSKGVQAEFEYFTPSGSLDLRVPKGGPGGGPGFGARVHFAEQTVEADGFWARKQDAKERAAELALDVLKDMEDQRVKVKTAEVLDGTNWIGMLTEYTQAIGQPLPTFQLFTIGLQFSCEATLSTHPSETFGSRSLPFPTKKAAKASAAEAAITWLRSNGHYETARLRKKKSPPMSPSPLGSPDIPSSPAPATNYLQTSLTLAPTLGLGPPNYELTQSAPELAPGFWDCAASFANQPRMPSEIGAVVHIFGKRNAKEECAKGVVAFMKELEIERKARLERLLQGRFKK